MTARLQPVRGTHDLLPSASAHYRAIEATARQVATYYGFAEIMTPMFEFSEVFHRTLGETSDVVSKETYSFADRGGEALTLRPELTAGIARAFISNGLQDQLPCKFFYAGPAFRYERPQKGRLRQFHQFGVELLGESEPETDAEIIACAAQILAALGVQVQLEINSLGDQMSRHIYREALVSFLRARADKLSADSQTRLEKNPLRVLDSKDAGDRALIADAPRLADYFTDTARDFFARVTAALDTLGIAYHINDRLVRGLDYYTHTVFEFTTQALGAQGTVLAGGRYDHLIEQMGGKPCPGIGFAAGIERLMALRDELKLALPDAPRPLAVIQMGDGAQGLQLAQRLRAQGFRVERIARGNMGKALKRADKIGAAAALILGENEIAQGSVTIKDLTTGTQETVALAELESAVITYRNGAGSWVLGSGGLPSTSTQHPTPST